MANMLQIHKNKALLDQIMTNIVNPSSNSSTQDDFYGEMEKHAVDLETEHPKAASLVREIVSTLNSLGI